MEKYSFKDIVNFYEEEENRDTYFVCKNYDDNKHWVIGSDSENGIETSMEGSGWLDDSLSPQLNLYGLNLYEKIFEKCTYDEHLEYLAHNATMDGAM